MKRLEIIITGIWYADKVLSINQYLLNFKYQKVLQLWALLSFCL